MGKGSLEGPYWEARELVHQLPSIEATLKPVWEKNYSGRANLFFDAYLQDGSPLVIDQPGIQDFHPFRAYGDQDRWARLKAVAPNRMRNLRYEVSIKPSTPLPVFAEFYQEKFGEWFNINLECINPPKELQLAPDIPIVGLTLGYTPLMRWQVFAAHDQALSEHIAQLFAQAS